MKTTAAASSADLQRTLERLRAEFLEMPGLRLTSDQIQRLCGVDPAICTQVLESMVEAKFLCARANGTYSRLTEGVFSERRSVKASVLS